ncbi:unnamed protein product [Pleuronectes platessa]|uniref:Uncharacterized protein n=1 Tax=Pleuronectes platessa TaxID=8262 RepID=A0A9N7YSZ7_PLEPL|nr:unnamed protein product [Pleuronectes platessa]
MSFLRLLLTLDHEGRVEWKCFLQNQNSLQGLHIPSGFGVNQEELKDTAGDRDDHPSPEGLDFSPLETVRSSEVVSPQFDFSPHEDDRSSQGWY